MSKISEAQTSAVISYLLLSYFESLLPLHPSSPTSNSISFGSQCKGTLSQEVVAYGGIRPINDNSVRVSCRAESLTMAVCFGTKPGVSGSHVPPLC